MSQPVRCPTCQTVSKAGTVRCPRCSRKLVDGGTKAAPAPPVTLQRVMGGEIFTAVARGSPGKSPGSPAGVPDANKAFEIGRPLQRSAIPVEGERADEAAQALASLADRFRERAEAARQRFKPYRPDRQRRADSSEARRAVLRQMEAATSAIREKRFDEAVEHLVKAISREDSDPRTWMLLGGTYLRLNQPYKAGVAFFRALELDPGHGNAWVGLSRAFKAIGDPNGSLEAINRAVEASSGLPEAWSERGVLLESLQNPTEAMRSFAKALALNPDLRLAKERHAALSKQSLEEPTPLEPPEQRTAAAPEIQVAIDTAEVSAPPPAPQPPLEDADEFPSFDDLQEPAPGPAKASTRPPRVKTFVEGLDETMGGGIPWGHVVLIQGAPGTMKSSLAFSMLLQNADREGLHTLYISLEERASSLLAQMGSLGLKLHVGQGSLVLLDPRTAKGLLSEHKDWVEILEKALAAIQAERGLDLVVIDSLEALEVLAKFQDHRREMFRLFEWLRDLGVTSFLITERPDWVIAGHVIQGRWDEDFLADGVVHLRQHLVSDLEVQRRLRIVKMRGTRHEAGYSALVLDEGRFRVTRAISP